MNHITWDVWILNVCTYVSQMCVSSICDHNCSLPHVCNCIHTYSSKYVCSSSICPEQAPCSFCPQASRLPVEQQKGSYEGQLRGVVDCLKEMEEEKRTCEEEKRAKERAHVEKMVCEQQCIL